MEPKNGRKLTTGGTLVAYDPPAKPKIVGDVRRGTALCIIGSNKFGAADCRDRIRSSVVGITSKDLLDGDEVEGLFTLGTMLNAFTGANGGAEIFLHGSGIMCGLSDLPQGAFMVRLGFALNETDAWIQIAYLGRKTGPFNTLTDNPYVPRISHGI